MVLHNKLPLRNITEMQITQLALQLHLQLLLSDHGQRGQIKLSTESREASTGGPSAYCTQDPLAL